MAITKVERTCNSCGATFMARPADVNRGWASFCSKSCKAHKQEKRTGQHAAFKARQQLDEDRMYHEASAANEAGWDGHKNS